MDSKPVPLAGFNFVPVRVPGQGTYTEGNKPFVDFNAVVAGILVLTAFALLLDWMVTLAERRLLVWQPKGGEPRIQIRPTRWPYDRQPELRYGFPRDPWRIGGAL